MSCRLRVCASGDEEALALIGRTTFHESFAGVLRGEDILLHCAHQHSPDLYRTWLADPGVRIWLAEIEPGLAPAGYLVVAPANLPVSDPRPDDREVKRIYVLQRVQRSGLGKRMMEQAIDYAVGIGSRRLLLGVYGHNDDAITFYERCGFARIGTRRFRVGNHEYDDLVLGLDL